MRWSSTRFSLPKPGLWRPTNPDWRPISGNTWAWAPTITGSKRWNKAASPCAPGILGRPGGIDTRTWRVWSRWASWAAWPDLPPATPSAISNSITKPCCTTWRRLCSQRGDWHRSPPGGIAWPTDRPPALAFTTKPCSGFWLSKAIRGLVFLSGCLLAILRRICWPFWTGRAAWLPKSAS